MEQATQDTLERGRAAFEHRAWDEAFALLTAAHAEQPLGADDLARLAESARWSSNYDAMFNAYERAEAAYAVAGESRRAARMAFELLIEHHFRRNESATMGWFARASSLLGDDTECEEYGLLLWCEARTLFDVGEIAQARPLLDEMLALARRVGALEIEAMARQTLGHVEIMEGRIPAGLRLIDESNALAMSGVPAWTAGMIYCSTIWACRNIGDWRRASEWTDTSIRWCERESVTHFPGLCRFHRAEVLRVRGALDDAERDALAAIDELMQANPRDAPWAIGEIGEIRRRRGDLDGAAEAFRSACDLGFDPQPGLALLRLDEGKPPAALRSITEVLANEDWFTREGRGFLLPAQVTIAIAAGELEVARAALAELDQLAERTGSSAFRASATCAAGELALAAGDAATAIAALRRGIRNWHEVDAPYEAAIARVVLARAYREIGEEDDAVLELHSARDALVRLGALARADRITAMLEATKPGLRAVRTFVFTDIVDSTRLVEVLGDEAWENLLAWHDRTLRNCFETHRGDEIKNEGDGFFVAFPDARSALECAVGIQRTLAAHRRDHGFAPRVRVGAHTAEATERAGDYAGHGVHVAARVAATANADEVVVSQDTMLAAGGGFSVLERRTVELKGVSTPVEVATIDWQ